MANLKRDRADCERLQALHAKAAGFPFPPANPAHAARGHGFTLYQAPVVLEDDGKTSYDMPTDAELGAGKLARLTGPERAELAAIRAKPEPSAARLGRSE
jgi:hypothetical protein